MNSDPYGAFDIEIVRYYPAPRELVFDQWSLPEHVTTWFAPSGFDVTYCEFRPRQGDGWRVVYTDGSDICTESGRFLNVERPTRLSFTLQQDAPGAQVTETLVVVLFEEFSGGTRMTFRQTGFDSRDRRDGHVNGWGECFSKLEAGLGNSARTS